MNPKDFIAFISNGKELTLAGVKDAVDLESHDQVIQADECNCTHKEHIASCEIVNVAVDVENSKKQIRRYVVEMAFCKECAAYYIPQKSYEFLSSQGIITHHIKGGVRLFEYMKHGDSYDEEKAALSRLKKVLDAEYEEIKIPYPEYGKYTVDDGCGGLISASYAKQANKKAFEQRDNLSKMMAEPYIGRIDVSDAGKARNTFYIGKTDDRMVGDIFVYSRWSEQGRLFARTAEPDGNIGGKKRQVDLRRKIDIQAGKLRGIVDEFASNSEFADKGIYDKFLIQVLMSRKKSHQLTDIIATIQDKQNEIIERAYVANLIVQGCAGSGKTMVMLHRLSFWLYNNKSLKPEKIKILTPNENFNVHIGGLHSQLNLGAIEIMSVDQYYSGLLDRYDMELSYHKKIDEEENIEERFLNYIYSKAFVKRMRALYPEVLGMYYTSEEQKFVHYCADKCDYTYKISDSMSDGEKLILFARMIGDIANKNNSITSELSRHEEKIEANQYKQQKCDEAIAEAESILSDMQANYRDELKRILAGVIEKYMVEIQTVDALLVEVRDEIEKLSGPIRRLISADALKKAQDRENELQKKREDTEKLLVVWGTTRNAVDTFKNIEDALAYFDEKKVLKSGNSAIEYLTKYRRAKRSVFEQKSIKEKLQLEVDKEQAELSNKGLILTPEEYKQVIELKNKYQKDITLQVFNVLFNRVIADKLLELDMKRSDKTYRYELYARVIFARMLWNKTVGEEELICVDEGQDVSFCEYEAIIEQNQANKAYYNVYGDLNQRIKQGRGLATWEQLKTKLLAHQYELNENYRNTNQITQYCNEVFNFDMTLTGVEGEPVRNITFKEMLEELAVSAASEDRTAVILPRTMSKTRVTRSTIVDVVKNNFSTKFDTSKVSVMYVDEIKGIEFDRVYVVDEDMERNERYIAFTRALDKLTIVH
ncbi:MAG: hypothetical protein ACI4TK_06630 [Agathobacter sp.]